MYTCVYRYKRDYSIQEYCSLGYQSRNLDLINKWSTTIRTKLQQRSKIVAKDKQKRVI